MAGHLDFADSPDALAEARAAFVAAFARGDVAGACAVYLDGARLLAPSAEFVQGRDAIERFWQAGRDSGIARIELDAREVAHTVGHAYEIGRYTLRLDPEADAPSSEHGAYLLIHEQEAGGTWRRAVEMFNPETAHHAVNDRGKDRRNPDQKQPHHVCGRPHVEQLVDAFEINVGDATTTTEET